MKRNLTITLMSLCLSQVCFAEDEVIFHTTRGQDGSPIAESSDGRQYPLMPIDEMKAQIEIQKRMSPIGGTSSEEMSLVERISLPRFETESLTTFNLPATFSLASQQTPIRDQLGRGTCWAMASVAAVEAAYKRKYGVLLNLSSQYAFQLGKAGELYPDYVTNAAQHENNSSYWGFQGNSGFLKSLIRAAIPEATYAPFLSSAEMDALHTSTPESGALDWNSNQEQLDAFEWSERNVPNAARAHAKYRVLGTNDVFDSNKDTLINKLEQSISSGHEVAADFTLKWKFDATKNAYDYDSTADNGGHVMLMIGYDHANQIFTLKNSWGGTSYLRVTYNFIKNAYLWGTSVTDVDTLNAPNQVQAYWLGNWNMDYDGWRGKLVIRRFTDFRNGNPAAATKLGDFYRDGKRYDVNGHFEDNGQHMVFAISDDNSRVVPGQMKGQKHDLYVFSWDPSNAAGKTYWNNIPFGSQISRGAIASYPSRSFDVNKWIGSWRMEHDGWRGTLNITGFRGNQINASYTDSSGHVLRVTGQYDTGDTHRVTMTIAFPGNNQNFEILHHTWEDRVFSGDTQWSGRSFGVQGYKN